MGLFYGYDLLFTILLFIVQLLKTRVLENIN
jgi:hypothetical protein